MHAADAKLLAVFQRKARRRQAIVLFWLGTNSLLLPDERLYVLQAIIGCCLWDMPG